MKRTFAIALLLSLLTVVCPQASDAVTVRSPVISSTFEQVTQGPLAGTVGDAPMTAYPGGYNWLGTHWDGVNGGQKHVLTSGNLNTPYAGVAWAKPTCIHDFNNYCIDFVGTSGAPAFTSFDANVTGVVSLWFLDLYWPAPGVSAEVLAFVHEENVDNSGQVTGNIEGKTRIGLAWSSDGGDSWRYLGRIISPYGDPQPFNIEGAPYIVNNGYFHVYYIDQDINGLNGIGVSRASMSSVIDAARAGNVGTALWSKYFNGGWTEPGLGGRPSFPSSQQEIIHTQAVHSSYTGKYYMPLTFMAWYNGQGGYSNASVKLYESTDSLSWSLSSTLVDEYAASQGPSGGYQCCSLTDVNGTANHEIGQKFYVYCHKHSAGSGLADFAQYQWAVDLGTTPDFYRQSKDFSSTQGPNWYYQYGTGLSSMTWNAAGYWQGTDTWDRIYGSQMHPGTTEGPVLKWVAPRSGTVLVSGTVRDADPTCGDGISAQLLHGSGQISTQIFSAAIANGDVLGKSHNLTRTVAAGDALLFKVSANADNLCDATFWDPSIVYAGPDVSLSATPPALVNSATAGFSFSSTDVNATFECKVATGLDTGTFAPCSTPYTTAPLPDGSHIFTVRAIDSTGSQGPIPANYNWSSDTTPPDTAITGHPADPTTSTDAFFSFTSPDTTAAFECNLDNDAWRPCSSGGTYHDLIVGSHTFGVRAKDPAGNVDPAPATYLWTINDYVAVTIGNSTGYFATISAAFASIPAGSSALIKAPAMVFIETPDLNNTDATLTFTGGYDSGFTGVSGVTTIQGAFVISAGTIEIANLVIM